MSERIDITGQRFGRWTVLNFSHQSKGSSYWHCHCDCGTETLALSAHLRSGRSISCGCYKLENQTTHGLHKHPMYRTWAGMLQRCTNPKDPWYHRYGGRGITVCKEWYDFAQFYADVGDRPAGMTMDRRNNDGPYAPWNIQWATPAQQYANSAKAKHRLTSR